PPISRGPAASKCTRTSLTGHPQLGVVPGSFAQAVLAERHLETRPLITHAQRAGQVLRLKHPPAHRPVIAIAVVLTQRILSLHQVMKLNPLAGLVRRLPRGSWPHLLYPPTHQPLPSRRQSWQISSGSGGKASSGGPSTSCPSGSPATRNVGFGVNCAPHSASTLPSPPSHPRWVS